MKERDIVARVRELFSDRIGDDGAIVGDQVLTSDMLVEDVDFTRDIPLAAIARKSLAVNLSDLAAMGATPSHALLALALPPWARDRVDEMLTAYAEMSRQYRIEIVGGDLSRSDKLVIAITAIGRIVSRPLLRSGAKPGERIYVSRPLGASAAGLKLLQTEDADVRRGYAEQELVDSVIRRHIDPEPEVALGIALAAMNEVSSCIDVSDGFSTDLHHLCNASACGARIEKERIPAYPDLLSLAGKGINVRECVLDGGEEYALLFTSSLRESELSRRLGRPVYNVGRMTAEREVMLVDAAGAAQVLAPRGFDHFD